MCAFPASWGTDFGSGAAALIHRAGAGGGLGKEAGSQAPAEDQRRGS